MPRLSEYQQIAREGRAIAAWQMRNLHGRSLRDIGKALKISLRYHTIWVRKSQAKPGGES